MVWTGRARPAPARAPRRLRRDSDGGLYDLAEHRPVPMRDLCDDVRSGRRFRVHRHDSGADCTREVLVEVLVHGLGGQSPIWPGAVLKGIVPNVRWVLTAIGDAAGSADRRAR